MKKYIYFPTKKLVDPDRPVVLEDGRFLHLSPTATEEDLNSFGIYEFQTRVADVDQIQYVLEGTVVFREHPEPIPPSLDEVKIQKKNQITSERGDAQFGGIEVNGIPVRTDLQTQFTLEAGRNQGGRQGNLSIRWKLADGTFTTLTKPQVDAMHDAVFNHIQAVYQKESDLVDLVDAASTVEEVEAISWASL